MRRSEVVTLTTRANSSLRRAGLVFAIALILTSAFGHVHPGEDLSDSGSLANDSNSIFSCSVCKFGSGVVLLTQDLDLTELQAESDVHSNYLSPFSLPAACPRSSRAPPIAS